MLKSPKISVGMSALPNGRIPGKETPAGRDRQDTLTNGCGSKNILTVSVFTKHHDTDKRGLNIMLDSTGCTVYRSDESHLFAVFLLLVF